MLPEIGRSDPRADRESGDKVSRRLASGGMQAEVNEPATPFIRHLTRGAEARIPAALVRESDEQRRRPTRRRASRPANTGFNFTGAEGTMNVNAIPAGENLPTEINVVIEIPGGAGGGSPVKYEIDKESGAVMVDRIVRTSMFYPCSYGFIPNSLHEDGDPTDVLVRTDVPLLPGVVIRCRPIGVLNMEDESGIDDKIVAVPIDKVDPFQSGIRDVSDLPEVECQRIKHYFERYKDLEPDKWVRVTGWQGREEAEAIILRSVEAYKG